MLVTSIGMNTWELALTFAARSQMRVIVVVSESVVDRDRFAYDICRRFHLLPAATGFYFIANQTGKTTKASWSGRDAAVIGLADRLFPVSIRPKGLLAALIEANREKVDSSFSVPYDKTSRPRPKYHVTDLNPAVNWNEWLIHFTRSSGGPWPDETEFDFYSDLVETTGDFCRSAGRTLIHIFKTGIIYGQSNKIRGSYPVVPFALINADSIKHIFRYRSRFLNPGLEPYGIAIAKDSAAALGIRPVIYGVPNTYDNLSDDDKPYFQNQGSYNAQWTIENEWRHLGDLHLDRLPADLIRIIVPTLDAFPTSDYPLPSPIIPLFLSLDSSRSTAG
ncbi:MAG: hypothetical protein PHR28_00690 [candidate division Zixibacteria bacterium]|nr:hypothetical protein [candidate division Zixibacteria bacterium]